MSTHFTVAAQGNDKDGNVVIKSSIGGTKNESMFFVLQACVRNVMQPGVTNVMAFILLPEELVRPLALPSPNEIPEAPLEGSSQDEVLGTMTLEQAIKDIESHRDYLDGASNNGPDESEEVEDVKGNVIAFPVIPRLRGTGDE